MRRRMGRRAEDEGASERRPVIGRIGVERPSDITLRRKPADFPRVFRHERALANRLRGQADMSAAATLAGAAPGAAPPWHAIPWRPVWRNVRRLQARIVKATQKGDGVKSRHWFIS